MSAAAAPVSMSFNMRFMHFCFVLVSRADRKTSFECRHGLLG